MLYRAVLVGLVAVGCGDRGVNVEIDVAGTGATKVRLYIGEEACGGACGRSMTPDTGETIDSIDVFTRARGTVLEQAVTGSTVVFRIEEGTANHVPMLVAVGLAGDEVKSIAVDDGDFDVTGPVRRQLALAPVNDRQNAVVWPRGEAETCVVAQYAVAGVDAPRRVAISPFEDRDCDNATPECDEQWYLKPASAGTACAIGDDDDPGAPCFLGTRGCADGVGSADACVPSKTCLPETVCAASSTCPDLNDPACVFQALGEYQRALCFLPGSDVDTVCSGVGTVGALFIVNQDIECSAALLSVIEPTGLGPPVDELELVPGVKLALDTNPESSCEPLVRILAPDVQVDPATLPRVALRLTLVGTGHELVIPIRFQVGAATSNGCGGTMRCTRLADDALDRCADL